MRFLVPVFVAVYYFGLPGSASPGCGKEHDFYGQTQEFSIESGSRTRDFTVHLPEDYKIDDVQPLLLAFHGRNGDPYEFEQATRFSEDGVNPDMIVVYPAGIRKAWEGPSYANAKVDDKLFTTDLVNHLRDNYCIDESRIYATGFSNGGGFVNTLACSQEHGRHFAAFAGFAAPMYTDAEGDEQCQPARTPLPMMELHGLEDPTVPYKGGEGNGGALPGLSEWMGRWAKRNKCESSETSDLEVGGQRTRWTCDGIEGVLEHVNTTKLGHFWPPEGAEVDVTARVLEFLSAHSKSDED